MRQSCLGHVEVAEHIAAKSSLQLLRRDIFQSILEVLLCCIVDEDVELPEGFEGLPYRVLAKLFLTNVASDGYGSPVLSLNELDRVVSVFSFLQIDKGDVGSLSRHSDSYGPTDAAITASDQHYLIR